MRKSKPITESQVATFNRLLRQGILEHLSNTGDWGTPEKIGEIYNSKIQENEQSNR